MAEKVEELVETLTADNELMNALIAVMRQSLQQFSVDSRAVQPVQPVHESLLGEFGTKTDVAQCSNGKSVADIDICEGPSKLNQPTECADTYGMKAVQPDSVPSELNQSKVC